MTAGTGPGPAEPVAVAIDVAAVPRRPAGAGRYVLELVRALGARESVALTLVARRDDAARWRALAPRARIVPVLPRARILRLAGERWALGALLAGLRRPRVEVFHGPHYGLPRPIWLPSVVTVHDVTFLEHPEWHERAKVAWFSRALREAARRAEVLVCVSERTAAGVRRRLAPRGEIVVVPHGVDPERFSPARNAAEEDADARVLAGLGVSSPYILHLGTLEPRKAVDVLLAAFERLAPGHPGLSLVLAGAPGWGVEGLVRRLEDSPLRSRVRRLGYVEDEVVPALLRRAAVVAYPSLEEGFGLPALEALACGTPLVTSAGSVMAELADGAATLARPGDAASLAAALAEALSGSPAVTARRRRGLEVAGRRSWGAVAAAHEAAYRRARERASGGRSPRGAGGSR